MTILLSAIVASVVAAAVARIAARAERRDAALALLGASSATSEALPAAAAIGKIDKEGNLRAPRQIEDIRVQCLLAGLSGSYDTITALNKEIAAHLMHSRDTGTPPESFEDIRFRMRVALIAARHEAALTLEARNTLIGSVAPRFVLWYKCKKRASE